jgi:hypothetical protein
MMRNFVRLCVRNEDVTCQTTVDISPDGRTYVLQRLEPLFLLLPILGRVTASATVDESINSAELLPP